VKFRWRATDRPADHPRASRLAERAGDRAVRGHLAARDASDDFVDAIHEGAPL
jgi:hypothetical protein